MASKVGNLLSRESVTGLSGGITRIQNVIGTSGNDILVGASGAGLDGGLGRDLIISGSSATSITSEGDSILIAGTTAYDRNQAALEAILDEWTNTDVIYQSRVSTLLTGLLGRGKVTSNGQKDTVLGGSGRNLFFYSTVDTTDRLGRRDGDYSSVDAGRA